MINHHHFQGGLVGQQRAGAHQQRPCTTRLPACIRHHIVHTHRLGTHHPARLTNAKALSAHNKYPMRHTAAGCASAAAGGAEPSTSAAAALLPSGIGLRPGTSADYLPALRSMVAEKMNPLGLDPQCMTVAEEIGTGRLVGLVQLVRVQQQGAQANEGPVYELRSLWVDPQNRGKGIARALVQQVTSLCSHDIYLTTLASRAALYQQHGFRVLPIQEVPSFLWFEAVAGNALARLAVNEQLIVMRRDGGATTSSG